MTTRFSTAMPGALADLRTRGGTLAASSSALASLWARLQSELTQWLARHRLRQSIAHLDDRLLDDIGLSPDDLGLAERLARRRAAGGGRWPVGDPNA